MKAWIVGLENIRPYTSYGAWSPYPFKLARSVRVVEADVVYQTMRNYAQGKPPHRVRVHGNDELSIYLEFVKRCEAVGFDIGDPP